MFLAIVVFFSMICYVIYKIACMIYNEKDLRNAEKNNERMVHMADGSTYDRKKAILGRLETAGNGDRVIFNSFGKVVYNYSEEERQKTKKWLLEHGYTITTEFIPRDIHSCLDSFRNGVYHGEKYRDLKTGAEYIIVYGKYLDLSTALFVRQADEYINKKIHDLRLFDPDMSNEVFEEKMKTYDEGCKRSVEKDNKEQVKLKQLYKAGEISQSLLFHQNYITRHEKLPNFTKDLIDRSY